MRLLILTDSLGLPRPFPEVVEYNETWCYHLKANFDTHHFALGGGTISKIMTQIEYLKMFKPDIVVIQSGIVDCAPRALSECENYLINKFYFSKWILSKLSGFIIPLLRKRGITYTSLENFESNLLKLKDIFGNKILYVNILPASDDYELKIPGITKKIKNYNAVIKKVFKINMIDMSSISKSYIMSDHIHLNKDGHNFLSNLIIKRINSL